MYIVWYPLGVGWGVSVLDNKDLLGNINELGVYYMVGGKKTIRFSLQEQHCEICNFRRIPLIILQVNVGI